MNFRWSVLGFIEDCQRSSESSDLVGRLSQLGAHLGFDSFAIVNLWQVEETMLSGLRSTSFDPDFVDEYARQKCNLFDPVWQTAENGNRPFRWSEIWERQSDQRSEAMRGLYAEAGVVEGFTVPIVNEFAQKSFVTFASDRCIELSAGDETLLALAAVVFRSSPGARHLNRSRSEPGDRLTMREREILTWTAAGKSAWEVSTILKLSEATVARHLLNIRAKLKAVNTVQAVARAIRLREIVN